MKCFLFAAGFFVLAVASSPQARAQTYPWCANFADGAGTNCGFSTEQQCRATILGSGGFCSQNELYKPPAAQARPAPRKHSSKPSAN